MGPAALKRYSSQSWEDLQVPGNGSHILAEAWAERIEMVRVAELDYSEPAVVIPFKLYSASR